MHIVLTICSGLILGLCALVHHYVVRQADMVLRHREAIGDALGKLREDRTRVTTNERELDALRRELRKLSGKFYAERREQQSAQEADAEILEDATPARSDNIPVCENWALAKRHGPTSEPARCQCLYCLSQRHMRDLQRQQLVPRTVQGQAEMAKLNAGKP